MRYLILVVLITVNLSFANKADIALIFIGLKNPIYQKYLTENHYLESQAVDDELVEAEVEFSLLELEEFAKQWWENCHPKDKCLNTLKAAKGLIEKANSEGQFQYDSLSFIEEFIKLLSSGHGIERD